MAILNSIARASVFTLALGMAATQQLAAQERPDAARLAAAEELLNAMNVDSASFGADLDQLEGMAAQVPDAAAMKDVMKGFMAKYMPFSKVKAEMTRLYAVSFTTAELRDLAAFYRTPLGRKTAAVQPKISADLGRFTQAEMMKHMPELQQMMMEKLNK